MTTATNTQAIESIQKSIDQILSDVSGLSEQDIRWNPTPEEWSILQVVSHLNEATPYWLGEVERVLAEPGAKWGRGLTDPARLAAVGNPDALDVQVQLDELKNNKQQVADRLGNLTEDQLQAENPHRNFEKFGNKPVSFIIGHFIDEHLQKHVGQVQRNISKLA